MAPSLPFRSRASNTACATAAPAAFSVVASLAEGADRSRVLLRGDHAGTFAGAKAHAVCVLASLSLRYGKDCVDVQVFAGDVPVLLLSNGGAS